MVRRTTRTSAARAPPKRAAAPRAAPRSNPWIEHVQRYRASHKCTFGEALTRARPSYRGRFAAKCDDFGLSVLKQQYTKKVSFTCKKSPAGTFGSINEQEKLQERQFHVYYLPNDRVVVDYFNNGRCKGTFISSYDPSQLNDTFLGRLFQITWENARTTLKTLFQEQRNDKLYALLYAVDLSHFGEQHQSVVIWEEGFKINGITTSYR